MWNLKNWKTVLILSIIVPMSLLASFRLTGIISEPVTVMEMINVEVTIGNLTKPSNTVTIDKWIENSYSDETLSMDLSMHVAGYRENWPGWPSEGDDDILDILFKVDADASEGWIYSIKIEFSEIGSHSIFYIDTTSGSNPATFSSNLKITQLQYRGTQMHNAYVNALHLDHPKNASLTIFAFLVFFDNNALDHQLVTTGEVMHFNGTAYRQINLPIQLGVIIP